MTRTIDLALNDFASVPPALVDASSPTGTKASLTFNLKTLFGHYYIAKFGASRADPGVYEYRDHITAGPDWRFLGGGIGADKEAKRNASNELGKGFARWFLHDFEGLTYFCPIEQLLDRGLPDGSKWVRSSAGDVPDYVCGPNDRDVRLLEAKGRYSSVTFATKEFGDFRKQIARVSLLDKNGTALAVKAYIAAARWATEDAPRVRSKLLVEDPWTEGIEVPHDGYPADVGRAMVAGHYVSVFDRLALPLQAEALRRGFVVGESTGIRRGIWECRAGALAGIKFVGGLIRPPERYGSCWPPVFGSRLIRPDGKRVFSHAGSPFELIPPRQFFGVEMTIFSRVLDITRRGLDAVAEVHPFDSLKTDAQLPAGMSLLRDGTALGPADFFDPIDVFDM